MGLAQKKEESCQRSISPPAPLYMIPRSQLRLIMMVLYRSREGPQRIRYAGQCGYARGEKRLRLSASPVFDGRSPAVGVSPDERGLGLALGVAEIEDQREVAIVYRDAGDIYDATDALLGSVSLETTRAGAILTFDSSDSWNMVTGGTETLRRWVCRDGCC